MALGATALGCKGAEAGPEPAGADPARSARPKTARATRVETAVISKTDAKLDMELPGEVEGSRDALLAAALGGYIEKVNVASGDRVKNGQVLMYVDTASHAARRNQAKVQVEAAKVEVARLKLVGDALPRAQLDAVEAQLAAAEAALRTAEVQVSRSVIRAPFAGSVDKVEAEVGEVAAPGAPLVRILQLQPAKVSISLSDRDVLALEPGMKVSVGTDARGGKHEGVVTRVHRAADLRTRSFIAEIEVANDDEQLLPGMIANVRVATGVASAQLVIAQDWLVTKLDGIGVFVNDGGVARYRSVKTGSIVRDQVVVKTGLREGDELVITGHRELADGDRLLVARKGTCCKNGRAVFE
jgi:RND family efflux transporter MFP subunit